jgi:hypothetical protein
MPDVTSRIMLLVLGSLSLFVSYQVLRHGRLYWIYPSISRFKRRKEDPVSKWIAVPLGSTVLLSALFLLWLGYWCLSEVL